MTDDRNRPAMQFTPEIIAAFERAIKEGAIRFPGSQPSDVITGVDAGMIRKAVVSMIDDELGRRQVLPESQIRIIAKDVAQAVYREAIGNIEERLRGFFTEEGIEEIVLRILKDAGIKADKQHADATREAVEAVLRGYRQRREFGADFLKDFLKALGFLAIGSVLAWLGIKGFPH